MRPRKTLFTPTGIKKGPSLDDLEKFGVADLQFCDGNEQVIIYDHWLTHDGQHRVLKKKMDGSHHCSSMIIF
eukprot:2727244-Karenia_brevis.AAC.1